MKSKPYTWLLFDVDDTLLDYDKCEHAAFTRTFEHIGVQMDGDFLPTYREINRAIWQEREQGLIDFETLKVERFARLFNALNIAYDPQQFSNLYLANLADVPVLEGGAIETLEALAPAYQFAVVTNGLPEVQRKRLKNAGLDHYFVDVIISHEIGVAKPAVEFFEITFDRIGNPPREETLIIGDSLTSDMQGATNYGIDACWFNRADYDRPPDLAITYEINRLFELVDLLG